MTGQPHTTEAPAASEHEFTWRGISIHVLHVPEWHSTIEWIEIETKDRIPLPITETGYRSHFVPMGSVAASGYKDAAVFVQAWLEHEANKTGWNGVQLALF
jgi:hypothetical protein